MVDWLWLFRRNYYICPRCNCPLHTGQYPCPTCGQPLSWDNKYKGDK